MGVRLGAFYLSWGPFSWLDRLLILAFPSGPVRAGWTCHEVILLLPCHSVHQSQFQDRKAWTLVWWCAIYYLHISGRQPMDKCYEGSFTFPWVTQQHINSHTSSPHSVIPVRALNYLCNNHGSDARYLAQWIYSVVLPDTYIWMPRGQCAPAEPP